MNPLGVFTTAACARVHRTGNPHRRPLARFGNNLATPSPTGLPHPLTRLPELKSKESVLCFAKIC
jgi:hypothetical protein